ncbi:golgin subfamily A member 6-like protein 10 [Perca fluviatilis]|uniref:golgin subfamily A member 6-like protein 10 n=1 Tax=Perca fluviatilis TaxID=8168 RepID=UPI001962D9CE|nr:golgin subfamily A member 6-like protein 10 [Perca fluviatilis]
MDFDNIGEVIPAIAVIMQEIGKVIKMIFDYLTSPTKDNNMVLSSFYQRLRDLDDLVKSIQQDVNKASVYNTLENLKDVLSSAHTKIKKLEDEQKPGQKLNLKSYTSELNKINQSLTEAFVSLSASLHVHQMKKLVAQEKKLDAHEKKLNAQEKKLDAHEKKLNAQEKKLDAREKKLDAQEKKLNTQEKKLDEQEKKLDEQEKKLVKLDKKLVVWVVVTVCVLVALCVCVCVGWL